ncbi:squalene/phytoene synthase family protein [Crossiella cryophila]|uniref:Farnesyl-diphosphate farnesyltransferase n=1 Tax=Crossiella cryophila TaxID=43355 RepID=A0A7W7CHZ4_9PSEU|nr:squalene/phytoene synthase family protein [Crossiella cryophila]MBB4680101.1 farnesyl-diphosphate farnesyltransferase [Crossiella cryophila]
MPPILTEALNVLRRHSITYVEPVMAMPPGLHETMAGTYLLMRGIDEVEDHPSLAPQRKVALLEGISKAIQGRLTHSALQHTFAADAEALPEVSLRLADWASLLADPIAARILEAFATMAERMADWCGQDFRISTERDLDQYTYAVAGSLALMLGDVWAWYDGTQANRAWLLGYGRGVQAANILADQEADRERSVSFRPEGWTLAHLHDYAERELRLADRFYAALPANSPARIWCEKPLAQAWSVVGAVALGGGR